MERSGTTPAPAIPLDDLRALVTQTGPFISAYLPIERAVENAAQVNGLRWKALRGSLDESAPPSQLEAIERVVSNAHQDHPSSAQQNLALVGAGDRVLLAESIDDVLPKPDGVAACAALPMLAPLVASRQRLAPHVVALVDRRGADLIGVSKHGEATLEEVEYDDERNRPESKSAPGGWSQRRFQQRVENRWEDGAGEVADAIHALIEKVSARLVILGGDDRMVATLEDALPSSIAEVVRATNEGRTAGSESDLEDDVRRFVHDVTARDTVAVIEKLREELGQGDRAVEGAAATFAALQQSQVDVLLVHDDPDDDRRAWFGSEPGQVALERDDLVSLNVEEPREGRLADVAIYGALTSGAEIRVVPRGGGPDDGLGALLRWS